MQTVRVQRLGETQVDVGGRHAFGRGAAYGRRRRVSDRTERQHGHVRAVASQPAAPEWYLLERLPPLSVTPSPFG